jgi:hypothetical protein
VTPLHIIGVAAASFVYIAAKAFQQLNVVHGCYRMVVPCTAVMAVCEVAVIGNIAVEAVTGTWAGLALTVAAMTVGSSAGAMVSMWLHGRIRGRG